MTASCALCADHTFETVYADAVARVLLHDDWAVRGHAMVVARRHVENLSDLDPDELQRFMAVHRAAERVLLETTGCTRAIVLKLGIATPHLHLHIYPFAADATRAQVFDAIETRTRVPRDDAFVELVRQRLAARAPA
jgi:diadenosine tetraphosphate (Ap4A) HIT family hydrolase